METMQVVQIHPQGGLDKYQIISLSEKNNLKES